MKLKLDENLPATLAQLLVTLGVCPSNPSLRGKGAAGRCKTAGSKNLEAYSLEYVEECFEPRTTQMLADRLPQ